MNEPTDEQIKEFWEWCGLHYCQYINKVTGTTECSNGLPMPYGWILPKAMGIRLGELPIDLNNLFKYAVPKLFTWSIGKNWELQSDFTIKENGIKASVDLKPIDPNKYDTIKPSEAISNDPTLALFWAIYEVSKGTK